MLVFGGQDSLGKCGDLWELSLQGRPEWRQLHSSGPTPPARHRHTATLDPASNRVLVFGGWGEGDGYLDDLWQLSLAKRPTWSRLEPTGPRPSPRASHSAVLVPDLGGLVVFGGASPRVCPEPFSCAQQTNDVWLLSLTGPPQWTNLTSRIAGEPPCGIQAHGAAYDAVGRRMIVIDGYGAYGAGSPCYGGLEGVWALSFEDMRWSTLAVTSDERPRARYSASSVFDLDRRRVLVHGGGGGTPYGDVWALDLSPTPSWSRVAPPDGLPPMPPMALMGRGLLVYDSRRDRIITYEGGDVWSYSFRNDDGWTVTPALGEVPPARRGAASIFDPTRRRVILHGGGDAHGILSDTWELTLDGPPAWSRLATVGEAPASYSAAAIYDPLQDRMILCGGLGTGVTDERNVWSLSLSGVAEWTPLLPLGSWRPRGGHAAVYDAKRDRMVVFGGGHPDADSWSTRDDTWALALSGTPQWHQLDAGGRPPDQGPPARALHSLVHDPIGDRMILVGGFVPGAIPKGPFDDAWEFRFDDRTWHPVSPGDAALPVWTAPASVYDSRRHRAVVFENDWLWSLQLASEGWSRRRLALRDGAAAGAGVEEPFSLRLNGPNPFSETFEAEVWLRGRAPASLALFDVAGRRVWSREIDPGASRRQIVRVEGVGWLRAGVYLLQLTQGRETQTMRVVHAP